MNNNIKFSNQVIQEIEKYLKQRKHFFKILDNFIIPLMVSFISLFLSSFIMLIYCGSKINEYVNSKNIFFAVSSNTLNFLNLWSNTNLISIVLGNIAAVISFFVSFVGSLEICGYLTKKEKVAKHKIFVLCLMTILFIFFTIFILYLLNTSNLPIGLNKDSKTFIMFPNHNQKPLFNFLTFSSSGYNNLLNYDENTLVYEGNYYSFLLGCLISIFILILPFFLYFSYLFLYEMKKGNIISLNNENLFYSIDKSINQKVIEIKDYKDINYKNDDGYYIKQQKFFTQNKNKSKKIPYEISFTFELDLEKKENKKLTLIETDDKDVICPSISNRNIERIKNRKKIDDLFIKEI